MQCFGGFGYDSGFHIAWFYGDWGLLFLLGGGEGEEYAT